MAGGGEDRMDEKRRESGCRWTVRDEKERVRMLTHQNREATEGEGRKKKLIKNSKKLKWWRRTKTFNLKRGEKCHGNSL